MSAKNRVIAGYYVGKQVLGGGISPSRNFNRVRETTVFEQNHG